MYLRLLLGHPHCVRLFFHNSAQQLRGRDGRSVPLILLNLVQGGAVGGVELKHAHEDGSGEGAHRAVALPAQQVDKMLAPFEIGSVGAGQRTHKRRPFSQYNAPKAHTMCYLLGDGEATKTGSGHMIYKHHNTQAVV